MKKGAKVAMLARSEDKLMKEKDKIDKEYGKGKVYAYKCDCSDPRQVQATADAIKKDLGVPLIIINNAGG